MLGKIIVSPKHVHSYGKARESVNWAAGDGQLTFLPTSNIMMCKSQFLRTLMGAKQNFCQSSNLIQTAKGSYAIPVR